MQNKKKKNIKPNVDRYKGVKEGKVQITIVENGRKQTIKL